VDLFALQNHLFRTAFGGIDFGIQMFADSSVVGNGQVPFSGNKPVELKPDPLLIARIYFKRIRCGFSQIDSIDKDESPFRI
jgi:hypothetical protein